MLPQVVSNLSEFFYFRADLEKSMRAALEGHRRKTDQIILMHVYGQYGRDMLENFSNTPLKYARFLFQQDTCTYSLVFVQILLF